MAKEKIAKEIERLAEVISTKLDGHGFDEVCALYSLSHRIKVLDVGVEVKDEDIETIEIMHDTLLNENILGHQASIMKRSRELTCRLYKEAHPITH